MSEGPNGRLHLPSLSIRGFRGIRELDVPRLGRVNLIAGRNGTGKTTMLEAVRVYASRGRERVLSALLNSHEEFVSVTDEDEGVVLAPDPAALFHGRDIAPNSRIEIGSKDTSVRGRLKIEAVIPSMEQASLLEKLSLGMGQDVPRLIMQVSFANRRRTIPLFFPRYTNLSPRDIRFYHPFVEDREELPPELNNRALGPGLPNNDEVSDLWDEIALTNDEDRAIQALNLVLDGKVDRVTMIGDGRLHRSYGRRVAVKLQDRDRPVPLRSLGDGVARLFGVALALVGSRNGFLVIDEAENGIHHSVHSDFWRTVLQTAEENDVQVFATTHSFDCVRGFARAAINSPESEGVLVRLERQDERTCAVVYSESELETAAKQSIEVR